MAQMKQGTDLSKPLDFVVNELSSAVGTKNVFIFTDGDINAKSVIDRMISVIHQYFWSNSEKANYNILCFLIKENGGVNEDEAAKMVGISRLVSFETFVDMENFFDKVLLANLEAPALIVQNISTQEIEIEIKSNNKYDSYEIHGCDQGANCSEIMAKTSTTRIRLTDLKIETKYFLKVRGKQGFQSSNFSDEIVVKTLKSKIRVN